MSLNLSPINPGTYGKETIVGNGRARIKSISPIDLSLLGEVEISTPQDLDRVITEAHAAFLEWRQVPAPKRGEIVREIADLIRLKKQELGELISRETGKILQEGLGEVQEVIDMADFAVGLSRQLYGLTIQSERPQHRMMEQWHPLGVVGVISAFNFPMAVWAWNALLGAVCGDVIIWKPSELTPLCAVALNSLCREVAARQGYSAVFSLVVGDGALGEKLVNDRRVPLISATGSCRMGKRVGALVAERMGRALLELGGNNAVAVLKDADLKIAIPGLVFGAVGTAGQRCTSTRRLLVDRAIEAQVIEKLVKAYKSVRIGDPLKAGTLLGPLINQRAVDSYKNAIASAQKQGGELLYGGNSVETMPSPLYVEPTIIRAGRNTPIVHEETFAPILYVIAIDGIEEAIAANNEVPQGLSSAIFTSDLRAAERFLSCTGSDCGIANVNLGTSGAEIGGAFGGEKDTGGGRESGSDAWKQYMRRQTNTINYGEALPLAQGIKFE